MSTKLRRQNRQQADASQPSKEDVAGERLCRKGQRLYQSKLKALLEPDYIGQFAAIEPDSGDYFVGERMSEAMLKAKEKHPNKLFLLVRIGFATATSARSPRLR
jgi:hypothetical protein